MIKIKSVQPKEFSVSLTMDELTARVVLEALEEVRSTVNVEEDQEKFDVLSEICMGIEEVLL